MGSQAIADIGEVAASSSANRSQLELKDILLKVVALAQENVRLVEPSLNACINDYAFKKKEVRKQIIKGMKPARLSEPLMQAPVFSEDLNIFPADVQQSTNALALTLDENKLVLPKESSYRKIGLS